MYKLLHLSLILIISLWCKSLIARDFYFKMGAGVFKSHRFFNPDIYYEDLFFWANYKNFNGKPKPSIIYSAGFGYKVSAPFRLEINYNRFGKISYRGYFLSDNFEATIEPKIYSNVILLGLIYDFNLGKNNFFCGINSGFAVNRSMSIDYKIENLTNNQKNSFYLGENSQKQFAWNITLGYVKKLYSKMEIEFYYSYWDLGVTSTKNVAKVPTMMGLATKLKGHSLNTALKFNF